MDIGEGANTSYVVTSSPGLNSSSSSFFFNEGELEQVQTKFQKYFNVGFASTYNLFSKWDTWKSR